MRPLIHQVHDETKCTICCWMVYLIPSNTWWMWPIIGRFGWGHFLVHPEVPISFSLAIEPVYSIYNVAVRGSPVFCTTSLLSSQYPFTPGSRGAVRVKCLAQGHNMRAYTGFKLWEHESRALPLSYACLKWMGLQSYLIPWCDCKAVVCEIKHAKYTFLTEQ